MAGQTAQRRRAAAGIDIGEAGEHRNEVDVAGERAARAPARLLGMNDDHRHVGLLLEGQRTLAAQAAVRAAELAVVSGPHRGRGPEVERRDRV